MGVPKITGFFIALILISAIAVTFSTFIAEIAGKYNPITGVTYDNSTFDNYQKIQNLSDNAKEIKDDATVIKTDPDWLDKIGAFFGTGYNALTTTYETVDTGLSISSSLASDLSEGEESEFIDTNLLNTWKTTFTSIIIVLFFIGIIVSILVKRVEI